MKKKMICLTVKTLFIFSMIAKGQTFQKGTLDVDLLSQLIQQKQEEVKKKFLAEIVVRNINMTNYTNYSMMYNMVNTILTEKNRNTISEKLIEYTADYVVSNIISEYYISKNLNDPTGIGKNKTVQAGTSDLDSSFHKSIVDIFTKKTNPFPIYIGPFQPKNHKQKFDFDKSRGLITIYGTQKIDKAKRDVMFIKDYIFYKLYNDTLNKLNKIGLFSKNFTLLTSGLQRNTISLDENNFPSLDDIINNPIKYADYQIWIKKIDAFWITLKGKTDLLYTILKEGDTLFEDFKKIDFTELKKLKSEEIKNLKSAFLQTIEVYKAFADNDIIREKLKLPEPGNNWVYLVGDIITDYIITDFSKADTNVHPYNFYVDVEGIIFKLSDKFTNTTFQITSIKRWPFSLQPNITVGLNYGWFPKSSDSGTVEISGLNILPKSNIGYASEKIGVKFVFFDWNYLRSQNPKETFKYKGHYRYWTEQKKKPIINNLYIEGYAGGLLYNITNLRTQKQFNYSIAGTGIGIKFFNGLSTSVGFVKPILFESKKLSLSHQGYWNFSFDIPLFEYIAAASKKRNESK